MLQHESASLKSSQRSDLGASRPPSRLGSIQPHSRPINPPVPNPAKPPKRGPDDEAGHRPAVTKPSNVQLTGEGKRQKTEDESTLMQPVRAPMAPPVRHSNIRKVINLFLSGVPLNESGANCRSLSSHLYLIRLPWLTSPALQFSRHLSPSGPLTRW